MGAGVGVGGIFVAVGLGVNVGLGVAVLVGEGVLVAAGVLVGRGVAVAPSDPAAQAGTNRPISRTSTICLELRFCFMMFSFFLKLVSGAKLIKEDQ